MADVAARPGAAEDPSTTIAELAQVAAAVTEAEERLAGALGRAVATA